MDNMEQWKKERDAFMAMIGQTESPAPKPSTKKEEE
jgi:hypothetical protein